MKILEVIKPTPTTPYIGLKYKPYNIVRIRHSSSNCKLSTVDYINMIIDNSGESIIESIKELLKHTRIVTYINTTDIKLSNLITKNFEIYGFSKIPVGYRDGYQYHIFIRNVQNPEYPGYARPIEPVLTIDTIKQKLLATLKLLRRKNDYVDQFINELQ